MTASSISKQLKNSNPASRIDILTEYIRISLAEFLEFDDTYSIAGTAILLSGTYSFLLRNFEEVKETTGFKELPESLKHEVETRRLGVNIYKKSTKK